MHLDPLYLLASANVVLAVALLWLAIRVHGLRAFVGRLSAERGLELGPELIEAWKRKMAQYPEGTPKHRAYRDKLRQIGEL